ncbi:MAG: pyruvate kinase [Gaiellaceae bacterium]
MTQATDTPAFSLTGAWRVLPQAERPQIRRTKIVATLGPASSDPAVIDELARAGMDAARLNFSHGTHDEHLARLRAVRRAEERIGRPLAVIADLCGPKIRVGRLDEPRTLAAGEEATFVGAGEETGEDIGITFPDLADVAEPGAALLINDGLIRTRVVRRVGRRLHARVEVGGVVTSGKGVNLPGTLLPIPALTEKDIGDLEFALQHEVDYVALSFVRSARDVERLRERIAARGSSARIIAKVEKAEAVANLDAILEVTDAVMVARGDLGVEIGVSEVPLVQKRMIAAARRSGRTVITATQMLESMISSPEPTRAEASDVANAIIDGSSAVMLSAETAAGEYPLEAVRFMSRIASVVEPTVAYDRDADLAESDFASTLTRSACDIAEELDAAVLAVPTETGATARQLTRFRPRRPIVAACPHVGVLRRLALEWGVVPLRVEAAESIEASWQRILAAIGESELAGAGDVLVLTGRTELELPGATAHVLVHRVA